MSNAFAMQIFEELTVGELEAAARSRTIEQRRIHLDQAGIFAALGERVRGFAPSGAMAEATFGRR